MNSSLKAGITVAEIFGKAIAGFSRRCKVACDAVDQVGAFDLAPPAVAQGLGRVQQAQEVARHRAGAVAVVAMANTSLQVIAAELVRAVRANSGTDWWKRENVRAQMRVAIRRILRKFGYPPDLTTEAVKTVLRQAEALATQMMAEAS